MRLGPRILERHVGQRRAYLGLSAIATRRRDTDRADAAHLPRPARRRRRAHGGRGEGARPDDPRARRPARPVPPAAGARHVHRAGVHARDRRGARRSPRPPSSSTSPTCTTSSASRPTTTTGAPASPTRRCAAARYRSASCTSNASPAEHAPAPAGDAMGVRSRGRSLLARRSLPEGKPAAATLASRQVRPCPTATQLPSDHPWPPPSRLPSMDVIDRTRRSATEGVDMTSPSSRRATILALSSVTLATAAAAPAASAMPADPVRMPAAQNVSERPGLRRGACRRLPVGRRLRHRLGRARRGRWRPARNRPRRRRAGPAAPDDAAARRRERVTALRTGSPAHRNLGSRRQRAVRATRTEPPSTPNRGLEVRAADLPLAKKSCGHAGLRPADGETRTRTGDTTISEAANSYVFRVKSPGNPGGSA